MGLSCNTLLWGEYFYLWHDPHIRIQTSAWQWHLNFVGRVMIHIPLEKCMMVIGIFFSVMFGGWVLCLWIGLSQTEQITVEGFHVKFSSHHTRYSHVGFLLAWYGRPIGKHSKMSHYILFSSYNITKLLQNNKILAHTLGENFRSFEEVNQKFKRFYFIFFLYCTIQKGNRATGQNRVCIGAYCIVQTLYCHVFTALPN